MASYSVPTNPPDIETPLCPSLDCDCPSCTYDREHETPEWNTCAGNLDAATAAQHEHQSWLFGLADSKADDDPRDCE